MITYSKFLYLRDTLNQLEDKMHRLNDDSDHDTNLGEFMKCLLEARLACYLFQSWVS